MFSAHLFNLSGKAVMLEDCHNSNPYHPIREAGDRIDCPMNFFRTSGDIRPQWGSVLSNLVTTPSYNGGLAGPGCWGCECMTKRSCSLYMTYCGILSAPVAAAACSCIQPQSYMLSDSGRLKNLTGIHHRPLLSACSPRHARSRREPNARSRRSKLPHPSGNAYTFRCVVHSLLTVDPLPRPYK